MIKTSEEFLEGSFKAAQIRVIKKEGCGLGCFIADSMNTHCTGVHSNL